MIAFAAALALTAPTCVGHRSSAGPQQPTFGVYRCTIAGPEESPPEFRMLLFAQLPDRLHAEVLGPMGGPRLVLDAGAGTMSITDVNEKVAYTGAADGEALARLIGVRIGIERLVAILLRGSDPDAGPSFTRDPRQGEGLPRSLELRVEDRSVRIRRVAERPVRADTAIGNGEPPAGLTTRPLEEFARKSP